MSNSFSYFSSSNIISLPIKLKRKTNLRFYHNYSEGEALRTVRDGR